MSIRNILIVDDEVNFCKLVKMNLESAGNFAVEIAVDGKAGINLAKKLKPDIILLDILMPNMDGFEVLKRLKDDRDTMAIPVVMLTARVDEDSQVKAAQLYDEDYIMKPIEAEELRARIEGVLKRRGSR